MSRLPLLAALMITLSCRTFSQQNGHHSENNLPIDTVQVRLVYLGAAGWEISDGNTVILVDPYLSRIRINIPSSAGPAATELKGDMRPVIGPNDQVVSDTAVI